MEKLPAQLKTVVETSNIEDLTKAEKIASNYAPLMNEVTAQGKLIKKLKKGNEEDLTKAKRIKIDIGKICAKALTQKKTDKETILLQTRFIDALYNTVNGAARLNQDEAKEIELHFENIEKEKVEKLFNDRSKLLNEFLNENDLIPDFIGEMSEEVWNNYFTGIKTNYNLKIEATEVEATKIKEEEELNILEAKRKNIAYDFKQFWTKNYDFRHMHNDHFKKLIKELQKTKKDWETKQKEIEAENKRLNIAATTAATFLKAAKEKADEAAKVEAAKLKSAKIQADKLQKQINDAAKKEAYKLAEQEKEIQTEKQKGDTAKIADLIKDLAAISTKYTFKSKVNIKLYSNVGLLINKIINYINK